MGVLPPGYVWQSGQCMASLLDKAPKAASLPFIDPFKTLVVPMQQSEDWYNLSAVQKFQRKREWILSHGHDRVWFEESGTAKTEHHRLCVYKNEYHAFFEVAQAQHSESQLTKTQIDLEICGYSKSDYKLRLLLIAEIERLQKEQEDKHLDEPQNTSNKSYRASCVQNVQHSTIQQLQTSPRVREQSATRQQHIVERLDAKNSVIPMAKVQNPNKRFASGRAETSLLETRDRETIVKRQEFIREGRPYTVPNVKMQSENCQTSFTLNHVGDRHRRDRPQSQQHLQSSGFMPNTNQHSGPQIDPYANVCVPNQVIHMEHYPSTTDYQMPLSSGVLCQSPLRPCHMKRKATMTSEDHEQAYHSPQISDLASHVPKADTDDGSPPAKRQKLPIFQREINFGLPTPPISNNQSPLRKPSLSAHSISGFNANGQNAVGSVEVNQWQVQAVQAQQSQVWTQATTINTSKLDIAQNLRDANQLGHDIVSIVARTELNDNLYSRPQPKMQDFRNMALSKLAAIFGVQYPSQGCSAWEIGELLRLRFRSYCSHIKDYRGLANVLWEHVDRLVYYDILHEASINHVRELILLKHQAETRDLAHTIMSRMRTQQGCFEWT